MSNPDVLAWKKNALAIIERQQARLAALEGAAREPIAIIGLGCRLPGAPSPEAYWQLLCGGGEAIRDVPPERWDAEALCDPDPNAPGKMISARGGFVDGMDGFDADLFGMAPREAVSLDPQQRLLLEVGWEALERAGLAAERLSGSNTGVFVGVSTHDYAHLLLNRGASALNAYLGTGTSFSAAAGRLSYVLGLEGPAVAVDTACSSSLVAVHQACDSLRSGQCDLALAGGVNAVLAPEVNIGLSRAHMLAPDGRCKAFDAAADGYVRGEGCGVVVLKRLADAHHDGDPVLAVLRGSAVNHNGRSGGLPVPCGPAQQRVVRAALARAGVAPVDVDYVEAHGTGTALGDPIEVQALAAVLGAGRDRERPLWLGSVKTNIGHLEAAAGIAGLIKVVLALQHGLIPRQLHFQTPNPRIPWQELPVCVAAEPQPWAPGPRRRIAGVSAFGFSGINSHAILEEAPEGPEAEHALDAPPRMQHLVALSARSEAALQALVGSHARWLKEHPQADPADVCYTLGTGRSHLDKRLAFAAATVEEMHAVLSAVARGESPAGVQRGTVRGRPKVAFLFTGQGSQYAGMARELYQAQPAFQRALDHCAELLRGQLPRPLLDVLWSAERAGDLDHTAFTQPCLFALEYALAELWRSWGVVPDVVLGHSVGEYAAACVAGIFTLEDGLRLIARRGALLGALPGGGAMAAVVAGVDRVRQAIKELPDLAIAAENGAHVVLSGPSDVLNPLLQSLQAAGVPSQPLTTSHAFHSSLMEPALAAYEAFAATIPHQPAECTFISNVTGQALQPAEVLDPSYWRRHAREPVLFARGVESLARLGCGVLLEIGPAPVLTGMARKGWPEDVAAPALVASLRRGRGDSRQLCEAAAALYAHGVTPDFTGWDRPWPRRKVLLPTYPFQRRRYWPDDLPAGGLAAPAHRALSMLGSRQRSAASGEVVYATHFSVPAHPFLADHRVYDTLVVPGATYAALALQAAGPPARVRQMEIMEPLLLDEQQGRDVQVVLSPPAAVGRDFAVYSTKDAASDEPWTLHARGRLLALDEGEREAEIVPLQILRERLAPVPVAEQYARAEAMGLHYGPAFQGLSALWSDGREVLGEVRLPEALAGAAGEAPVHPAVLDACTQVVGLLMPAGGDTELYLPLRYEQLDLWTTLPGRFFCHGKGRESDGAFGETRTFDITLLDEAGARLGILNGLVLKRAPRSALLRGLKPDAGRLLYEVGWQDVPADRPEREMSGPWLVLGEGSGLGAALAERLTASGRPCLRASADDLAARLEAIGTLAGVVVLWGLEDAAQPEAAERLCADVLNLVQQLTRHGLACEGGLWLCTRGSQAVAASDPVADPAAAALWGLGRVIETECPNLHCHLLDLDPADVGDPLGTAEKLARELGRQDAESQRALRGEHRFVPRLVRRDRAERLRPPKGDFQLQIPRRGSLEALRLEPASVSPPGPGQVQVRVRAAGLNFRDVLNALGLYPGDPGPLGGEWAGEVVAVGEQVEAFTPGDRVFGFGSGCFSSQTIVPEALAAPVPAGLSDAEAATVPIAFCTAAYALERLAGLRPGQRVLIHAASGGVGLAAVQLAVRAGAEVWATASEAKQAYLRSLGVRHVFNSRSTDFAGHIRAATDGRGIDVVLNSLTGAGYIAATLSVLAPGGTFVEIGKRDIWTAEQMRQQRPDVAYHILALDELLRDRPAEVGEVLGGIVERLRTGELRPLPTQVFPVTEAVTAFRHMQRARHIGKIVLSVPATAEVRADATYLVTGGLGALGLETARWLVRRGARHLVLAGRREPGEAARQTINDMQETGCSVRVVAANVACAGDVRRLLDGGLAGWPPLRGVFHTAGVLDDVVLVGLNRERLEKVLAPKVQGAWYLHEHTRQMPLDFFVLYSSIAALLGPPGQGSYAAGNAFLDGLAEHRRARGLPALSIGWGPWAGAGMAANVDSRGWLAQGLRLLRPEAALEALEAALSQAGTALALDADWARVAQAVPRARGALLANVLVAPAARSEAGAIRQQIGQAPAEQRAGLIQEYLQRLLQHVLGAPSAIDPDRGFLELGMDSIMALELRKQVEADLGIDVPISDLLGGMTVRHLAGSLCKSHSAASPQAPAPATPERPVEDQPLSAGQAGLWVIHQLAPQSPAYNVSVAAATEGVLDLSAFRAAYRHLALRHPVLRTTFTLRDGEVLQRVGAAEVDVEIVEDVSPEDMPRRLEEDARRPFDLGDGPVCRIRVYQHGPEEQTVLLTVHHAVGDFVSVIVLMEELLLASAHPRRQEALPPAPAPFGNYVAWERNWLTTPAAARQLAYWRGKLAGELPVLALPADRRRPSVPAFHGGSHALALDPELVRQLRQLAREERSTLYVVLLSAWAALLHRHTSQAEVMIGSPTLGRPLPEFSRSVGNFINTLALRLDLSRDPTFRELLGRTRTIVYEALENADYPFPLLGRELGKPAEAGRSPLFQVMFAYDQVPQNSLFRDGRSAGGAAEDKPALRGQSLHVPQQAGQLDLSLFAVDHGERFNVDLTYDADLFEPDTVARLADHFRVLLSGAVADPGSLLSELPLQSAEERRQVLVQWNDTRVDYPADVCLHQLIESQVRRSPEAVAVEAEGGRLTYRQLNDRANRLAHALRRRGVGPDTLVGVCMERSSDLVVALLGILKAGGAYVPLDPDYPRERLALMLQDTRPPVVLAQEQVLPRLPSSLPTVLCPDGGTWAFGGESNEDPVGGATADSLAYVIYTSGSTGTPKGAMNTHRGICNRLLWMQDAFGLTAADRVLQKTPFSFDVSVWELFWPLLTGARLVLARPGGHREPRYLAETIAQRQVTIAHFVPSMLRAFLEEPDLEGCQRLRHVVCSGEALPVDLQERFFARLPAQLHNLYGPTEAAVDVTSWTCRRGEPRPTVPLGRPIANMQVYVLDEHRSPLPVGVAGELHLGGVGLARGYLNRPELTAEKFIANPFSTDPNSRLYRTGDLARWLPDGNLEFLGRIDTQVKVRGNRIELEEIEGVLTRCPGVRQAAVTVQPDATGDSRLVAHVVAEGGIPSSGELRGFLQSRLPEYMIPSVFLPLAELPLTSSGKLDRKALPAPVSPLAASEEYLAPRTATEKALAEVWSGVLRHGPVGVRDSFFDLGGHSLLAVRLLAALEARLGLRLNLADLFREPTIEGMARRLSPDSAAEPASVLVCLQPNGSRPPFFCVHPSGGTALGFADLARTLGSDQPFYAFQSRGLRDDEEPLTRVEDMAALYLEALREVQPQGPYRLGGWSFGGIVAWEMAQQLQHEGEQVEILALLDASPACTGGAYPAESESGTALWLAREAGIPVDTEELTSLEKLGLLLERKAAEVLGQAGSRLVRALARTHVANLRSLETYEPQPYAGPVHVFRARDAIDGGFAPAWLQKARQDPSLGWADLVPGDMRLIEVPGNHLSMVRPPHLVALARALRACLEEASSSAQGLESARKPTLAT